MNREETKSAKRLFEGLSDLRVFAVQYQVD
jgi:hypothetical protein